MHRVWLGGCFFASAFLAFLIQPMIGKIILPRFGGTPSVWSGSMLFFQTLLLAGYGYSHQLASRVRPHRQPGVHLVVVGLAAGVIGLSWWVSGEPLYLADGPLSVLEGVPMLAVLLVLSLSVGLPFFLLSTTTSLLQSWSARVTGGQSPYRFFAVSNVGSLLGLLSYPLCIEPLLSLRHQTILWSIGFLLFAIGLGAVALRARQLMIAQRERFSSAQSDHGGDTVPRVTRIQSVVWIGLPTCSSMLLLAVTNQLTQDVAVFPLLWVGPLVLYLLTFIICFGRPKIYSRWLVVAQFFATVLFALLLSEPIELPLGVQIGGLCVVLFVSCMVCHGELHRQRPEPALLTRYYLSMAAGGALGGLLVALVAPLIFDAFHELAVGMGLVWVMAYLTWIQDRDSALYRERASLATAGTAIAICIVVLTEMVVQANAGRARIHCRRNFFGTVWVSEASPSTALKDRLRILGHGSTWHGAQHLETKKRGHPTTYYGMKSGVGLVLIELLNQEQPFKAGVVGLGIGTLSTYGRTGDTFRFYEINPAVIELAQGKGGYFSFLKTTKASVEIVAGDARRSLTRELGDGSQGFDILILDAFSSHSIPIHLLTRECFELYLNHLQHDGVIAAHIGNPHINLKPVLHALAAHFELNIAVVTFRGDGQIEFDSIWILLTRDADLLEQPSIARRTLKGELPGDQSDLWTDDFSNPLALMFW